MTYDRVRERGRGRVSVETLAPSALAREPFGDDVVLLGVALEREIQEWSAERCELKRAGGAGLYHGDIAGGEVFVKAGHITADLHAGRRLDRRGIDPGAADNNHACIGDACADARVRGCAPAE